MILGQGERQEGLEGPIGRARGVVFLAHQIIWPGKANGEGAGGVQDRLLQPPADLPRPEAADFAPGQGLHPGIGQSRPEASAGETIGQGAALDQGGAVGGEPFAEGSREFRGAVDIFRGALRVLLALMGGVDQPVEMDRKPVVMIDIASRTGPIPAIGIPAIVQIQLVKTRQVTGLGRLVDRNANALQAQSRHQREEMPVVVGHADVLDMAQPRNEMGAGGLIQTVPQLIGRQSEGKAESGHFHRALVVVLGRLPVFGMLGIGAVFDAFAEQLPMREIPTAGVQRGEAPERTGEAFKPGGLAIEMGGVLAELDESAAGAEAGQQRLREVEQQLCGVGAVGERIHLECPVHRAAQSRPRRRISRMVWCSNSRATWPSAV